MCGIAGTFDLRPGGQEPPVELLEALTEPFAYRGPDEAGYHTGPGVGLAVRRLAIMDPEHGQQPMYGPGSDVVSVCNGEIYNHRELRKTLEASGHVFRTRCDVEVLVPMYRQFGTGFVEQLNGQFAFAVYDRERHRLVLGRDQMGITPLFYTRCGDTLVFASEIKGILQYPGVAREVDLEGLDQMMTFPGLTSPRTMFKGIQSLPPGYILVAEDGRIEVRCYWDIDFPPADETASGRSGDDAAEELEAILMRVVERRLQADVPVGLYISGGLDSSLVAALVGKLSTERRHSFSIRFPSQDIDEGGFQGMVVDRVGTQHHETLFDSDAIGERLRDIVFHAETPLRESYNTCSLALSALVHGNGMKVVLTGEGADELLGGYVGYRLDTERGEQGGGLPDVQALLEREWQETFWGAPGFLYEREYVAHRETRQALYSDAVNAQFADLDCTRRPILDTAKLAKLHPFHRRSYVDCKMRLADHLLADHGDRVAYANSVEARYPYLDLDLVDFVSRLSPELLLKDGQEKALLRRVGRRHLPGEIPQRGKFAFVAPGTPLLLQAGTEWVADMLSREQVARWGYFNPDTVERLKRRYSRPGFDLSTTFEDDWLMLVLTFGILLETFELPALG